ncbi:polymer-forming cytoskeletal protein [Paenibacillus sp. N1-5-1-14]|uniref:polymer-forming cytoskeletal protein n=1 Tax=Paenibacillus radicibacter TaxID=2972488 RepID=UPI0021594C0D|nr:polymer-forming cytoskeletal protein [Paenibacillus radicibacter]MCR8641114.1 polymer-forming cytoskeletal protein [Paenibacillus radicibacter]
MRERVSNLIINGSGTSGGGDFQKVKISGSGKVSGNVECLDFHCSGSGVVYGDVKAGYMNASGSVGVEGNLITEELKVSGSARVDGDAFMKEASVSGYMKVKGQLTANEISINGAIEVKDDVSVDEFNVKGGFRIAGQLHAKKIDIQLYGDGHVKSINADQIEVRRNMLGGLSVMKMIKTHFQSLHNELHVDVIEGENITLEYTTAKVVRGKNVTIGAGCKIDLVEYTGRYEMHGDAKVGQSRLV